MTLQPYTCLYSQHTISLFPMLAIHYRIEENFSEFGNSLQIRQSFTRQLRLKFAKVYFAKCNLACYSPKFFIAKVSLYTVISFCTTQIQLKYWALVGSIETKCPVSYKGPICLQTASEMDSRMRKYGTCIDLKCSGLLCLVWLLFHATNSRNGQIARCILMNTQWSMYVCTPTDMAIL